MKSWLFSVVVLFILAKAFLWLKTFILPLPLYVLAGAFLAIASNYDRGIVNLLRPKAIESNDVITQTASVVEETAMLESKE